jgi:hypothetical protein
MSVARRSRRSWSGGGRLSGYSPSDPWTYARLTAGFVPNYQSILVPVFKSQRGKVFGADAASGNHLISELRDVLQDGAEYVAALSPSLSIAGIERHCKAPTLSSVPEAPTEPVGLSLSVSDAPHPRGNLCQRPAMKGKARCNLHGGAPGSGAPRGNRNALKHGHYSAAAVEARRMVRALLRSAREFT